MRAVDKSDAGQREQCRCTGRVQSLPEIQNKLIEETELVVFNSYRKGTSATNELRQVINAQDAPLN
jgi:hypothetical protein